MGGCRDGHCPRNWSVGIGIGPSNMNASGCPRSPTTTSRSPQAIEGGAVRQVQSRMAREQKRVGRQPRRVYDWRAAALFSLLVLSMSIPWLSVAASSPVVSKAIQSLYDKKEYQQALDELAKLDKEQSAAPGVRRLKTRVLLKLGSPKEAMEEYDKLDASLKQDDIPILREVALGFIVVMLKDMRDQMRGAAYTALKEVDSDEVVPFFEDGLSDGSGPVRALAVEGLGRSETG